MRNLLGRFRFGCWCAGLLIAGTTVQAEQGALISLRAVKINPTCTAGLVGQICGGDRQCDTGPLTFDGQCGGGITPTNTVSANPGDIIVAEAFGSNWSPTGQGLRSFQVAIDSTGYTSGGGRIVPLGWKGPPDNVFCEEDADCPSGMWCQTNRQKCEAVICTSDPDCPPEYPVCRPEERCTGANHHPERGAFADEFRFDELDWVFQGCGTHGAVDMGTLDYRYGWLLDANSLGCAPTYAAEEKYLSTLVLVVPEDACGIFIIPLVPNPATAMVDSNAQYIKPLKTESLTIDIGTICPCFITGSTPDDCALDGRQPSEPDGTLEAGWSEMQIEFDQPCLSCGFSSGRFSVSQIPAFGFPPISISDVECTGLYTATVTLSRTISTNTWTCVRDVVTNGEVCVGYLPGDSDKDSTSDEADLLNLIDCLNGDATCEIHQCDMDRSGLCGPADLLREIDLLNGAEMFDPWNGERIERFGNPAPCPSQ